MKRKQESGTTPAPPPTTGVEQGPVFVTCPECGAEQADMGRFVLCESCGEGTMPWYDDAGNLRED